MKGDAHEENRLVDYRLTGGAGVIDLTTTRYQTLHPDLYDVEKGFSG